MIVIAKTFAMMIALRLSPRPTLYTKHGGEASTSPPLFNLL
jgi:hypothetical protein